MIEYKVEEVNSFRRHISFTVEAGHVDASLKEAYSDLQQNARLPGFRKGKVPTSILRKKFGRSIRMDVAQKLVEEGWKQVDHQSLEVVSQPSIEGQLPELRKGSAFQFVVGVDVRPHVAVTDYKGIEVVYPASEATNEEVDARIESMLSSKKSITEVEDADATVTEGDYALLALVLKDGEGNEVANEPGTMFHVGGNKFYTGLEEHVIGMKSGESKDATVTISEESNFEHLRGGTFEASIELKQIQRMSAPALTDELAEELEYESVEDMRAKLTADISKAKDENFKNQARVQILQHLVAHNEFDVPQGMVEEQFKALTNELRMQQMYMGKNPDDVRFSDAQRQDLQTRAVFAAKAACLLGSVNDLEELEVTEADIDAKLEELAEAQGQTVEAIKQYISMEQATEMLTERVQEEKTLNWLLDNAVRLDAPKVSEAAADETVSTETVAETETTETSVDTASLSLKNTKDELVAAAKALGIATSGKTKAQLLEAIQAV